MAITGMWPLFESDRAGEHPQCHPCRSCSRHPARVAAVPAHVRRWGHTVGVRHIGLAALLLTAGCSAFDADTSRAPQGDPAHLVYTIRYELSAYEYDEAKADAALERCTSMEGARRVMTKTSEPPHEVVGFVGVAGSEAAFEDCLRALPDTRLTGPREIIDQNDGAY